MLGLVFGELCGFRDISVFLFCEMGFHCSPGYPEPHYLAKLALN